MAGSIPAQFEAPFKQLEDDLLDVGEHWQMFHQLFVKGNRRIELMQLTAPAFFGSLQQVLLYDVVAGLARLNDKTIVCGRANLVLGTLVEILDPVQHKALIPLMKDKVDKAKKAADPFVQYRHKIIGHRDYGVAVGTNPSPQFKVNEANEALNKIADTLNTFKLHFTGAETAYLTPISLGNADALLFSLRQSVAYHNLVCEGKAPRLPIEDI